MARRPPRGAAPPGAALAVALGLACASSAWHVPQGHEGRFREARKVCRQLTDADDGSLRPDRFERCMERRGWRHERFTDRLGISL